MTVRKGEKWGQPGAVPPEAPIAHSDAELARLADIAPETPDETDGRQPTIGLVAGDLHRTLGSPPPDRMHGADAMSFPIDLGRATLDGTPVTFAAHLVAGPDAWFRSRTVIVMNAAFIGPANLGPKAHPGDGLLDVTDGRLPLVDRLRARRRYGLGTHLPHPDLRVSRVPRMEVRFDRPVPVRLDGVAVGSFREVTVVVDPDALTVVV